MDQATVSVLYSIASTLFGMVVFALHQRKSGALNTATNDLELVQNVALPKVQAELDNTKKLLALVVQKAKDGTIDENSFQQIIGIVETMVNIAENKNSNP